VIHLLITLTLIGQAVLLILTGIATWWCSGELMLWLIWMVGEEYALGADNAIRLEGGGTLLTNPGAMIRWTIPFWGLAFLQMSSGVSLGLVAWSRFRKHGSSSQEDTST